jgi:hypothetical protein
LINLKREPRVNGFRNKKQAAFRSVYAAMTTSKPKDWANRTGRPWMVTSSGGA